MTDTISRSLSLLTDMVMELHFRGCEDTHPLIQRAGELIPRLKAMAATEAEDSKEPATPKSLHMMTAQAISILNIEDVLIKGIFPESDLAEAAFTLENELMARLEDDNTMPMNAYFDMSKQELIRVIKTTADTICRLRS